MNSTLVSTLPWVVGLMGGGALIAMMLSVTRVDRRWLARTLSCPRCRATWLAGETRCPSCQARGNVHAAPQHRLPARYWVPTTVLASNDRDFHGFDEAPTVLLPVVRPRPIRTAPVDAQAGEAA